MAKPAQVEFPGQKKTKVRMRGTKHANEATVKKITKELTRLLENPRSHLPAMTWSGKLRWGRTDSVTKTLRQLEKVIKKKNDLKKDKVLNSEIKNKTNSKLSKNSKSIVKKKKNVLEKNIKDKNILEKETKRKTKINKNSISKKVDVVDVSKIAPERKKRGWWSK